MIKLTVKMVMEIHDLLIETDGGEPGIRDIGTLEYLVDNINREDGVFRKAAWALTLAEQHPFLGWSEENGYSACGSYSEV